MDAYGDPPASPRIDLTERNTPEQEMARIANNREVLIQSRMNISGKGSSSSKGDMNISGKGSNHYGSELVQNPLAEYTHGFNQGMAAAMEFMTSHLIANRDDYNEGFEEGVAAAHREAAMRAKGFVPYGSKGKIVGKSMKGGKGIGPY